MPCKSTKGDQQLFVGRERAETGTERKQRQCDQEDRFCPNTITQIADNGDDCRSCQEVAGADPGNCLEIRVECPGYLGKHDADNRVIENRHEQSQAQ